MLMKTCCASRYEHVGDLITIPLSVLVVKHRYERTKVTVVRILEVEDTMDGIETIYTSRLVVKKVGSEYEKELPPQTCALIRRSGARLRNLAASLANGINSRESVGNGLSQLQRCWEQVFRAGADLDHGLPGICHTRMTIGKLWSFRPSSSKPHGPVETVDRQLSQSVTMPANHTAIGLVICRYAIEQMEYQAHSVFS